MSKGGSSETTKQIPDWLAPMLKPLLQQSTGALKAFGAQGQDILHGSAPRQVSSQSVTNPNTAQGAAARRADLMAMREQMMTQSGNR